MTLRRIASLGAPLLAAGALAALAARWGYRVRTATREVARRPPPPNVPQAGPDTQTEAEGTGPRFYRRYRVRVADSELSPRALLGRIAADLDAFVPQELARFEKTRGAAGRLEVGDEYLVHITSPWDGPVRVAETSQTHFVFATREGHMEAGLIRFSAEGARGAELRFEIESWARSADATVDLVYDKVGVARQAQQAMWTFFCDRVAEACGGRTLGEVEVLTEREAAPGDETQDPDTPETDG